MYVYESVWALGIKSDQAALNKNSICRLVLKSQQQQQKADKAVCLEDIMVEMRTE